MVFDDWKVDGVKLAQLIVRDELLTGFDTHIKNSHEICKLE